MDEWNVDTADTRQHSMGVVTGAGPREIGRNGPQAAEASTVQRSGRGSDRASEWATDVATRDSSREVRLTALLDAVYEDLLSHDCRDPFTRLVDELADLVAGVDQDVVRQRWRPLCAEHPINDIVQQDPFTRHSATKPRGYAGDADLIDLIYGVSAPGATTSSRGTEIFAQMMARRGPASVRHRRALIASTIDAQAEASRQPISVLSLACGHVREAVLSEAVSSGRATLTAFDQDRVSVDVARAACVGYAVDVAVGSVRQAITQTLTKDRFDLVYSAGLYDYLADSTASRLTARLFELVRPGGRLLVANFLPTNRERGYMETFMDWYLHYRSIEAFSLCSREIPEGQIEHERTFTDPDDQIVYLELTKR